MKAKLSSMPELLLSFRIGAIGGAVCGIIILSFNSLIAHSGWDWGDLGLGIMYGSFFGILMLPLGYIIFLRKIGFRKAIAPAFLGTIVGGLFGAFAGPLAALCYGCLGFFSTLAGLSFSLYLKDRSTASKRT